MVLPGMAKADVAGGDAQHMDVLNLRQLAGGVHPGAAMHAEREAHVVGVVVQYHQLERCLRAHAPQQRQAEVVEIATAKHDRAELGRQRGQHVLPQAIGERRVDEHQVGLLRRGALQPAQGIGLDHGDLVYRLQLGDGGGQVAPELGIALDQGGVGGAARDGLQAQRAAAGEQVEHPRPAQPGHQPVEQRFANAVAAWPQARQGRHRQAA
ncbi:hypothetical protein G6F31_013441 [Rhizopus arrhizus]|nr:hypothetical protein G6F31_013441 [Rhizopus arrhizus]